MQESILQYAEHHESVLLGEQYVMWFLFQGSIIFAVPRYAWRRPRGFSVPSGYHTVRSCSQPVVGARNAGAAMQLLLSLRPFAPDLEVAQALQVVEPVSQLNDLGQANDWKPQCGYSILAPELKNELPK
jgi:hypothetical protein